MRLYHIIFLETFSIMSGVVQDNSGNIDFREFVISLWNYCTLGDEALGAWNGMIILSD